MVCAVTDLCAAEYDIILPADVVRELQATSVAVNVSNCDVNNSTKASHTAFAVNGV